MVIDDFPEFMVGLIRPRLPHEAVVERLKTLPRDPGEIGRHIAGNRCLLVADEVLDAAGQHPVLDGARTAYAEFLDIARARRDLIERTCGLLDRLSRESAIPVWGIKGLASRAAYPDPTQRQLSDADVAVESQEGAFYLAHLLRQQGFRTDEGELPWLKADLGGVRYGQYRLLPPSGYLAVDIHFGRGYSTGHCGLMSIPMPREVGLHPLPAVENLAPMLGNSGGDVHITAKDVNDLWVASEQLTTADADALMTKAAEAGFLDHLRLIAHVAVETTAMDDRRLEVVSRLAGSRAGRSAKPILASGNKPVGRFRRAFRTARNAYHQAKSLTSSRVRSTAIAANAFAYYSAPLKIRVAALPTMRMPRPAPWRCVRLVPLEVATSRGRSWSGDSLSECPDQAPTGVLEPVEINGRPRLFRQGRSLLVPTVWYVLPAKTLRMASRTG